MTGGLSSNVCALFEKLYGQIWDQSLHSRVFLGQLAGLGTSECVEQTQNSEFA